MTDILDTWGVSDTPAPPKPPPKAKPAAPRQFWHMLKSREAALVRTRCGQEIKIRSGTSIQDALVTGWESQVTCPGCTLP